MLGGRTDSGDSNAVFALEGQSWTNLKPMKNKRSLHACSVFNNNLVIIGGYGAETDVEMYDIIKKTWTSILSLPTTMTGGHSVIYHRRLYAIYNEGKVLELSNVQNAWKDVENIGKWDVGYGSRPVFPPTVLTLKMLSC